MKKLLLMGMIVAAIGCRSTTRYGRQHEAMISSTNTAPVTSMSSRDIAGVMDAANNGEIQQAQAALPHLTSQETRDFANMMISDHTMALGEASTVFSTNHIVARNSSGQAAMLRDQSKRIISTLNNSGSSADRVYIQSQVDVHQGLLTLLDSQLIPSAHNDLLNMLQKQRSTVAAHLDRARQILATMP